MATRHLTALTKVRAVEIRNGRGGLAERYHKRQGHDSSSFSHAIQERRSGAIYTIMKNVAGFTPKLENMQNILCQFRHHFHGRSFRT